MFKPNAASADARDGGRLAGDPMTSHCAFARGVVRVNIDSLGCICSRSQSFGWLVVAWFLEWEVERKLTENWSIRHLQIHSNDP